MKLTEEILLKLGFRGEGRDVANNPAYRLEVPKNEKYGYYYHELQVVLGDYPEDNPNCGIVSLYDKAIKDVHCQTWEKDSVSKANTKIDFVQWQEEGQRGGIKYIDFPERITPIASHVTTLERLNEIYVALTGNPPFEIID